MAVFMINWDIVDRTFAIKVHHVAICALNQKLFDPFSRICMLVLLARKVQRSKAFDVGGFEGATKSNYVAEGELSSGICRPVHRRALTIIPRVNI